MYGSSYFAIQATEKYSAAIYYSYNEQSFDSMTWKILQLSTCFWVDVKVNNLSVVGHIGIDSIQTFLHNKNVNFEILFGLCAQAVPKGHDIVTLRIMKMILKTTVKRPSASYAQDWLGQLFLIHDLVWPRKCCHFRDG